MQKISNASDILKLHQRGLEFSIITVILNKDRLFICWWSIIQYTKAQKSTIWYTFNVKFCL